MIEALYAAPFFVAGGFLIGLELRKAGLRKSGTLLGLFIGSAGIVAAVDSFYSIPVNIVYLMVAIYAFTVAVSLWLFFKKLARAPT